MTLSDLSIRNPVFAWMLMAFLVVFGAVGFSRLGVSELPDVDFRLGALSALPLETASVDLAVCVLSLMHVAELGPPVAELAPVVRPGGRLVVSDFHPTMLLLGGRALYHCACGTTQRSDRSHGIASHFALRLIGSLAPAPPGDRASSPGVTHGSSVPCRPQTPWCGGWMRTPSPP